MIHGVFIEGTDRVCWRYCQGEKQVLPRDFVGSLGNRFSMAQDSMGSIKLCIKDRQHT